MSHTCRPGHPGILADDCERCAEHAAGSLMLTLDQDKMAALWDKMIAVEIYHSDSYETETEAKACAQLYTLAVWMQRYLGVNPYMPFGRLREWVGVPV